MKRPNKKTIEISLKSFETLAKWESIRATLRQTLTHLDEAYNGYDYGDMEEEKRAVRQTIAQLQALTEPLDEVNAVCKTKMLKEGAVAHAIRRSHS